MTPLTQTNYLIEHYDHAHCR